MRAWPHPIATVAELAGRAAWICFLRMSPAAMVAHLRERTGAPLPVKSRTGGGATIDGVEDRMLHHHRCSLASGCDAYARGVGPPRSRERHHQGGAGEEATMLGKPSERKETCRRI